jgi:hypothetical protein
MLGVIGLRLEIDFKLNRMGNLTVECESHVNVENLGRAVS